MKLLSAALATCTAALAQLPPPPVPAQNPITPAKAMLGKVLFWDEQLSSDDSVACGTCHLPEFGGGDGRITGGLHPGADGLFGTADDVHGSAGIVRQDTNGDFVPSPRFGLRRQATGRMSPTNVGAAHHGTLFWDGRAGTRFDDPETGLTLIPYGAALETQAVAPILNAVEMGEEGRTWQDVRTKLQSAVPLRLARNVPLDMQQALQQNATYPALFRAAFGSPAITGARIAMALATYQRTLSPDQTPWDRFMGGSPNALTVSEHAGWLLFVNQGRCVNCHWDPLFSDDQFHNLGLRPAAEDIGHGAFSPVPDHYAAFKTPSLRNAGLRTRLFHNGQSPALGDPAQATDPASTLNVYLNGGGVDPSNLDPFLLPLIQFGVTAADVTLIQDFVRTALTDPRAALRLPPFDHPDLRSAVVAPPRVFGQPLVGTTEPLLVDTVPMFLGNHAFKLGIGGGTGPGIALLAYGFGTVEPAGSVIGLPVHVVMHDLLVFPLAGQPGQIGHATWHLPIPNDPTLLPIPFCFQVLALDPQAPGGIASSRGYELFIR